jgi:hypothetical protein
MVNNRRLGMGPETRLSTDRDFYPGADVDVLSSTLVKLYRAMPPYRRIVCESIENQGSL